MFTAGRFRGEAGPVTRNGVTDPEVHHLSHPPWGRVRVLQKEFLLLLALVRRAHLGMHLLSSVTYCLGILGAGALRIPSAPPALGRPAMPSTLSAPLLGSDARAVLAAGFALVVAAEPAFAASAVNPEIAWVAPTKAVMGPILTLGTLAFLFRVVLSWFPKYDLKELPWSVIAIPTEPFLKPTRALVPPVAGVDISPIVWVALLSFFSEIFLGPQGLLTIIEKKGSL